MGSRGCGLLVLKLLSAFRHQSGAPVLSFLRSKYPGVGQFGLNGTCGFIRNCQTVGRASASMYVPTSRV